MFEFLIAQPYTDRVIGRHDGESGFFVSTAAVNDGAHPYETAVKHRDYDDGKMVIVEAYDDRKDAEAGHERWVETMTADELPPELRDCLNAEIAQVCGALDPEGMVFPRRG